MEDKYEIRHVGLKTSPDSVKIDDLDPVQSHLLTSGVMCFIITIILINELIYYIIYTFSP